MNDGIGKRVAQRLSIAVVAAALAGCATEIPDTPTVAEATEHRVVAVGDDVDPAALSPGDERALFDYLLFETDDYPASFPPLPDGLHRVDDVDVVTYQVAAGTCEGVGSCFERCTWDQWMCRKFEYCNCGSCGMMVARCGECSDYSCS